MLKTHGSLFSGIGGFDLAAQWMGWENLFHCEYNPFGQKVLKHYWPSAHSFHDITKSDFTDFNGRIDILTGGFPCQPYSTAGKRLGKEDERHLWPHMLRAIREVQPVWVVGENVRGLVSWNAGMVFDEVQADLENEGYEVFPVLLPACGVNAPHRRERIWFIAHSAGNRWAGQRQAVTDENRASRSTEFRELAGRPERLCLRRTATNTARERFGEARPDFSRPEERIAGTSIEWAFANAEHFGLQKRNAEQTGFKSSEATDGRDGRPGWKDFPVESPVCSGNDGLPFGLDGITFSKWRTESLKAAGNAIVPQVALQIFEAIDKMEILY